MIFKSSPVKENIFKSLLNAVKIHGKKHMIAEDISRQPMSYKNFILKSYVIGEAVKGILKKKILV